MWNKKAKKWNDWQNDGRGGKDGKAFSWTYRRHIGCSHRTTPPKCWRPRSGRSRCRTCLGSRWKGHRRWRRRETERRRPPSTISPGEAWNDTEPGQRDSEIKTINNSENLKPQRVKLSQFLTHMIIWQYIKHCWRRFSLCDTFKKQHFKAYFYLVLKLQVSVVAYWLQFNLMDFSIFTIEHFFFFCPIRYIWRTVYVRVKNK